MRLYKDKVVFTHYQGFYAFRASFAMLLENEEEHVVKFGWTILSPKDRFCRKTGRTNALKRLESEPQTMPIEEAARIFNSELVFHKPTVVMCMMHKLYRLGEWPRQLINMFNIIKHPTTAPIPEYAPACWLITDAQRFSP